MNHATGRNGPNARKILKAILSLCLLLHCANGSAAAQGTPSDPAGEIYAGIELTTEGIRAIALRVSKGEEEPGLKLIHSENIRMALGRSNDGSFDPRIAKEAAQTVLKLMARFRQQWQVPPQRIFLIGGSELGAARPEELINAIGKTTGKTIAFLDVETEVQLALVGTISRLWKVGDAQIDNRNSSALIEVTTERTLGGYQTIKYPPGAPPRYDFVTMSVPHAGDVAALRQALRREWERKPGFASRKRVYLTGAVPWALVTLLYPEDRRPFVQLGVEEIEWFAEKLARAPQELLTPNLSFISDKDLRQKAELEIEAVKVAFTPQKLAAGAEALKAVASEFEWREKQVWFARFGYLGRLLSYIRLQAEK